MKIASLLLNGTAATFCAFAASVCFHSGNYGLASADVVMVIINLILFKKNLDA